MARPAACQCFLYFARRRPYYYRPTPAVETFEPVDEIGRSDPLETCAAEIDEIDDRLQDLLIERIDIVRRIAAVKATQSAAARASTGARGGDPAPAGARRRGDRFPRAAWCGCGASCSPRRPALQAPLSVAVYVPPDGPASGTSRATITAATRRCVRVRQRPARRSARSRRQGDGRRPADAAGGRATRGGGAAVGPRDRAARVSPGCRSCGRQRPRRRRRRAGDRRGASPSRRGDDRTLLAIEAEPASRAAACAVCCRRRPGAGLARVHGAAPSTRQAVHLIEIDGFVPADDPRLADVLGAGAAARSCGSCRSAAMPRRLPPDRLRRRHRVDGG